VKLDSGTLPFVANGQQWVSWMARARITIEGETEMGKTAIVFGFLLILLGAGIYVGLMMIEDSPSKTALIPAFFGLPIVLLGLLALKDAYRKHAMHVVAVLALLGVLAPVSRLAMQMARGAGVAPLPMASMIFMALLSGGLLALCIKSFVDARRRRAAGM
jgi:hypothetical protein